MVAGLTSNTQEAMLEATVLQEILELPDNITGQGPALLRQHVLEPGPVFLDQLIKQRVLWLMSLVLKWANGPEIVLKCIGWQDRESQWSCDNQPYSSVSIAVPAFTIQVREVIPQSDVRKYPKAMREICGTQLCTVVLCGAWLATDAPISY